VQPKTDPQILFFAPFVSSTMRVDPTWVDFNGHLNMAYYNVLFDRAVDEAFAALGLGPDYAAERKLSTFAAQAHVAYLREVTQLDPVRMTVQLIEHDEKRLHLWAEMRHAHEGWTAATCESMHLHVDLTTRKVAPLPPEILANLAAMKAAHGRLPRPAGLGAPVAMRRPAARETSPTRRLN
jgi:acyl-CoA thioester hydrolase